MLASTLKLLKSQKITINQTNKTHRLIGLTAAIQLKTKPHFLSLQKSPWKAHLRLLNLSKTLQPIKHITSVFRVQTHFWFFLSPHDLMLSFLCARRKTWTPPFPLSSFSLHHTRLIQTHHHQTLHLSGGRHHHTTSCRLAFSGAGAASIWHAILPSSGLWRRRDLRRPAIHYELKGEGSWNAALDARPARWLHRPDSAWLLFGVCNCLAPRELESLTNLTEEKDDDEVGNDSVSKSLVGCSVSSDYRVTGVLADGRCLFRAIAHVASLRNGEEPPDENRQRELADELRAQVVDELLKRREESEWFIEGDFDAYVKRIQQPYIWGGEPELIMASHVKKTPISVYMVDRSSGGLVNIAEYGAEYGKEEQKPINVLFHGYGHYDILESFSEQSLQKLSM